MHTSEHTGTDPLDHNGSRMDIETARNDTHNITQDRACNYCSNCAGENAGIAWGSSSDEYACGSAAAAWGGGNRFNTKAVGPMGVAGDISHELLLLYTQYAFSTYYKK